MSSYRNIHAKRAGNKGKGGTAGYDERKVEYRIDVIWGGRLRSCNGNRKGMVEE